MNKISTKQAFSLLSLINKMELRNKIVDMAKDSTQVENRKQTVLAKLYKSVEDEEITNELTMKLFSDNVELYEEYKALESTQNEVGMMLIFDILEALPKAEKEFYKASASIFNKTVKEIEDGDIVEVIKDIMDIFKSESFLGFFKSMVK